MKVFAFIMAFIILGLSCIPCADDTFINNDKAAFGLSKMSAQPNEDDHQDDCSPFCQCACCAGFAINHTLSAATILPLVYQKLFASYLPADIIGISLPVWQPPQLVC